MNDFKERLTDIGMNYTERQFRIDDGIDGIVTEFLVSSDAYKPQSCSTIHFHKNHIDVYILSVCFFTHI